MPHDAQTPHPEAVESASIAEQHRVRDALKAQIAARQTPVPEHLRGKLYSARDLMDSALSEIDAAFARGPRKALSVNPQAQVGEQKQ